MKPGRFNVYLLFSILLVGAGYYVLNHRKELNLPHQSESDSLIPFNAVSLREMRIESDAYEMEIQGEYGQWLLTSPVKDLASTEKIEAFLNSLSQISFSPVVGLSHADSPSNFGTEPPLWKLEFSDGFEQRNIFIGHDLPVGNGTYIRFPGEKKLYVTSTSVRPHLPDTFEYFRDLSLMNGKLPEVTRFDYTFSEQNIEARKDGARSWTLVKPFSGRGNRAAIETLIQSLLTLKMSGVAADRVSDPGVYGIDENSRILKVEWDKKPAQTIQIGSREAGSKTLYVNINGRDSIYTLPAQSIEFLNIDPENLRDRRPLPSSSAALQSISIQHPEFSTRLFRSETNWVVKGTRTQPAQTDKINALIALWTAPVIEGFAPRTSNTNRPASDNLIRIEFEARTENEALGKWIFEAAVDKLNNPSAEVLSVSDQELLTIPSVLLNPATLKPVAFYKPELWTFPLDKTQGLEYGLHSSTNLTRLATGPDSQTLSILQSITPLSIAAEDPEMMPEEYFSEDTEKLVFKLPAEEGISRTLLMGNVTENGNRFVKQLGSPLIFLVNNSTLQKAIFSIEQSSVKSDE